MSTAFGDIQVPTITEDDLMKFHQLHFPGTAPPSAFFRSDINEQTLDADASDYGLGFYDDGEPRTLTDTQISIFRHSEIQRILLLEAGHISGPIFPKVAEPKKRKTHIRNKDRETAKKVGRTEQKDSPKTELDQESATQHDAHGARAKLSKNNEKRKRKREMQRQANNAKPGPSKMRRRNSSSLEPEPKPVVRRTGRKLNNNGDAREHDGNSEAREPSLDIDEYKDDETGYTFRRHAREEDEVPNVSIELDY